MEFQNLNILVLDDDERIREELSEFLTRRKSVVFSAGCPSSAFSILKHNQIDLLFLDFALPEMDGLLVLKKVLSMYPRLKVIMISGTGNSNLAIQAKEKGAVEFLRKPFLHYEVKKALEKLPNIKKNKNKIRHQTNKRSKKKGGIMTRQTKGLWIGVLIGLLLFATALFADVPALIDYQGRLTDDNGDPLNGSVSIEFKIYDVETGGSALWTETQTVSVSEGLFQVSLGEVTTLDLTFEDAAHWLGINVSADGEMTPRTRITSVAYAINAGDVKGNDIHPESVNIDGYGEVINSSGEWTGEAIPTSGDNLGDHTATQDLDMDSNKIVNLSTPTADNDAATKAYVDSTGGDNLGDHTATQNIDLNGHFLSGDGGIEIDEASDDGVYVYHAGSPTNQLISSVKNGFEVAGTEGYGLYVGHADYTAIRVVSTDGAGAAISNTGTSGIKVSNAGTDGFIVETAGDNLFQGGEDGSEVFEVSNSGDVTATSFTGDGSGLTGVSGDNLGNHTATQNIELDGNWLSNDGGSEGVFVATDGDVGIGTSSPGAVLDVTGSGTYGLRVTETGGADSELAFEQYGDLTLKYGSNEFIRLGSDGGPARNLELKDTGTTTVKIRSDDGDSYFNAGDVCIGTTSGPEDFNVQGSSVFSDDIYLRDGSVSSGDYLVRIWDNTDQGLIDVYDNNTVKTRIYGAGNSYFNGGNLGIGTASPSEELEVNGKVKVEDGLIIDDASSRAIDIDNATSDGVYVYNAGSSLTSHTSSVGNNGFEVAGAQAYGLYVGRADDSGVYINSTAAQGIEIDEAGYEGILINSVGNAYSPLGTGVKVTTATQDGFYIGSAGDDGFVVNDATGQGFYVNDCEDGLVVNDATDEGISITHADDKGVYSNTDVTNGYGFYTYDRCYASGGYYPGRLGTFGRNDGSSTLEPGDIVCISGGYEENVLGEDSAPVIKITKATKDNSDAIFGVVEYKVYVREQKEEQDDGTIDVQKSFRSTDGNAMAGDYVSIIVFGTADVKVESSVNSGENLTVGDNAARKVQTTEINGITVAENTGIIGKALEDSNGRGTIKVFVNCK